MFESFSDDPQWNYLRLELSPLEPSGVYPGSVDVEELTDLGSGKYTSLSAWNENEYKGKPLPKNVRRVERWLRGSFVIFQKTSQYNLGTGDLDAYDGRHNKMTAEEFHSFIEKYIAAVRKYGAPGSGRGQPR